MAWQDRVCAETPDPNMLCRHMSEKRLALPWVSKDEDMSVKVVPGPSIHSIVWLTG